MAERLRPRCPEAEMSIAMQVVNGRAFSGGTCEGQGRKPSQPAPSSGVPQPGSSGSSGGSGESSPEDFRNF